MPVKLECVRGVQMAVMKLHILLKCAGVIEMGACCSNSNTAEEIKYAYLVPERVSYFQTLLFVL